MTFKERLAAAEKKANIEEIKKKATSPFHVDIANGVYGTIPVKAECGFRNGDENKPYWQLGFLVHDGSEGDGKQLPIYFNLAEERGIENAYRAVAALGYDVSDEDFSLADSLEMICEELLEQQPDVKVKVSTSTPKDGPNAGNTYQNFNIQRSDWGDDSAGTDEDEEEEKPKAKAAAKPKVAEPPAKPPAGKRASKAAPEPEDDEDEEPVKETRKGRRSSKETPAEKKIKAATVEEDEDEEPVPTTAPVDEEEDEDSDDEADLEVGHKIAFEFKGETLKGKVLEFIEDDTKVRVEVSKDRIVKVKLENITEVIK